MGIVITIKKVKFIRCIIFKKIDKWNGLTLEYQPTFPLNLIMSSSVMDNYS